MEWRYKVNRLIKHKKNPFKITLSIYNSDTDPHFKQLDLLKIEDQLKLQGLKCILKSFATICLFTQKTA